MKIKEIKGYPQYYVTDTGEVIGKKKKKPLNQSLRGFYLAVTLCNKDGSKSFNVHRLVAEAFIPNPNNYPMVNHRDENPLNNNVNNLEWCDATYNNNYGTKIERTISKQINRKDCSHPVSQYTLDGKLLARYPSVKEAHRKTGVSYNHIGDCCRHYKNQYSSGGYIWLFSDKENELESIPYNALRGNKRAYQFSVTGEFIAMYDTITIAAKITGIHATNIVNAMKGKQKHSGGFIWKYEKDVIYVGDGTYKIAG